MKILHFHMTDKILRDYHLMLDAHGDQIFSMSDDVATANIIASGNRNTLEPERRP